MFFGGGGDGAQSRLDLFGATPEAGCDSFASVGDQNLEVPKVALCLVEDLVGICNCKKFGADSWLDGGSTVRYQEPKHE